jgi:very-short-patch-repair endonuclease
VREHYTKRLIPQAKQMRHNPTPAEAKLWEYLGKLPFRVRRQCPLRGFILDFYIHKYKLVIELDGEIHDTPEAKLYDAERTKKLEAIGLQVIRFKNREVLESFDEVCGRLSELWASTP